MSPVDAGTAEATTDPVQGTVINLTAAGSARVCCASVLSISFDWADPDKTQLSTQLDDLPPTSLSTGGPVVSSTGRDLPNPT